MEAHEQKDNSKPKWGTIIQKSVLGKLLQTKRKFIPNEKRGLK